MESGFPGLKFHSIFLDLSERCQDAHKPLEPNQGLLLPLPGGSCHWLGLALLGARRAPKRRCNSCEKSGPVQSAVGFGLTFLGGTASQKPSQR